MYTEEEVLIILEHFRKTNNHSNHVFTKHRAKEWFYDNYGKRSRRDQTEEVISKILQEV